MLFSFWYLFPLELFSLLYLCKNAIELLECNVYICRRVGTRKCNFVLHFGFAPDYFLRINFVDWWLLEYIQGLVILWSMFIWNELLMITKAWEMDWEVDRIWTSEAYFHRGTWKSDFVHVLEAFIWFIIIFFFSFTWDVLLWGSTQNINFFGLVKTSGFEESLLRDMENEESFWWIFTILCFCYLVYLLSDCNVWHLFPC